MYLKRQNIGALWPIPRKGTKYLARPMHGKSVSMPILVVMREILGLVKNKKELKQLINENKIVINNKIAKETNYPVALFDSVSLPSIKKCYRVVLRGKKIGLEEISEKDSHERTYKVMGKKLLSGKKVQINLSDGRNLLSSEKIRPGDFAVVNLKEGKIARIISLHSGTNVIVIKGKHIGAGGKVKDIAEEGGNKIAEITSKSGTIKVNVKNLFITGE